MNSISQIKTEFGEYHQIFYGHMDDVLELLPYSDLTGDFMYSVSADSSIRYWDLLVKTKKKLFNFQRMFVVWK